VITALFVLICATMASAEFRRRDVLLSCSQERDGGEHMNAETETAIQNLSKAFADTADTMKRIANSLVNIELHLQAMRPSGVQTVRPTR